MLGNTTPAPLPIDNAADSHRAYLEDVTTRFIEEVVNRRDPDPLILEYLCPYFQTYFQFSLVPTRESRAENNAHLRAVLAQNPKYSTEVVNICTNLDLPQRKARVWVTIRVRGIRDEALVRERVSILDWVKRANGWKCVRHTAAMGPGGWSLPD